MDPSSPFLAKTLSSFEKRHRERATIVLDDLENGLRKEKNGELTLSWDVLQSIRLLLSMHAKGSLQVILVTSDDRVQGWPREATESPAHLNPVHPDMVDYVTRMTALTDQEAAMAVEELKIVEKGSMRELSEFVAHFISLDHEEASARLPGYLDERSKLHNL
ncbi:hypothetical protein KFL_000200600 [Klebsormidium nitens]|uniref:Uncharacterized protein n=1 Tax=Klebsormidium nitens TaxID=105231 RepID=A0A1Y1HK28_KLENI|nr:hypothetical protein KFL_000200600 [Klebsormidium nitens]|eukprot:GAQ78910.1 hypothetical protein KFL_000200600 [Klebsormidium nitens]